MLRYTFTDAISMPLSAAEKQRRYRARRDQDPERRAKYLEWERKKWKRDREQGKKKSIHECSQREQRLQRRKWRQAQAKSRAAKKAVSVALSSVATPPVSPEQANQEEAGPSRSEQ